MATYWKRITQKISILGKKNIIRYQAGYGTIFQPGFTLEVRDSAKTPRVFIGENSVLSCRIVLEREIGNVKIGNNTYIGSSTIICAQQVNIGSDVLMAWGITIIDHDSHSLNWEDRANDVRLWREGLLKGEFLVSSALKNWHVVPMAPVIIKDKAWIGAEAFILKGVTIGEGAVIASRSVVTKDVDPWTLVAGNPARLIKELPRE